MENKKYQSAHIVEPKPFNIWARFVQIQRNRLSANLREPRKLGGVKC